MFQTFETATRPENGPPRLAALRAKMAKHALDGYLVPRSDVHQGEYVAPADECLAWLTGFTGSAGFCAVLNDVAGVFVDGRYRVQVHAQIDPTAFTPVNWPEVTLAAWLRTNMPNGGTFGFDSLLHTKKEIDELEKRLAGSGIGLKPMNGSLVHAIWDNRPPPPSKPISAHSEGLAGESSTSKRTRLGAVLKEAGQDAVVLTLPDSICWLLNIRGSDVAHNPVMQCFAILQADGSIIVYDANPARYSDVASHIGTGFQVQPVNEFHAALRAFSGTMRVDAASAPLAISQQLAEGSANTAYGEDPCILPKACKNAAEIAGSAEAHLRDGAAMVEFLTWLDATAPNSRLTEIDVVTELEVCRRATNALREISFETIAGSGPNGAIVHYRVTKDTNREVKNGELLLIDSGGQYVDGTTDITRTVAVGDIGQDEKECFTRVLQGMIAISRVRWPKGLAGRDLDALARYPLWLAGQDYDHGTGHGVGAFLSVHEGPQRISKVSDVPLQTGMILSNEPGYYREGAFGIRIENLIVVEDAPALPGADARTMLSFRTLTFVPIDRRLILTENLTNDERAWVDAYHAQVFEKIAPRVTSTARIWLEGATAPL
ncbi:aminopeptidase P family protein [Actibacterium lipolyticum]|uniref:Xaa-Pro dipeptidase n=1 Tax=Actibacterium lipolyticum TaxID=1524263 RepID=A0A238JTA1_9RHOB|nr:aminopeptidase P family protein [Actibacterium lipolyticum]SMX33889.1 Xaa-Pro dipeptidase [Actibacterium lipolyticum]